MRLITGGEDGMICWWNFSDPASTDSPVFNIETNQNALVIVDPHKVKEIKSPAHKILLTVSAQIYSIIVGPRMLVFGQNDSILTFYRTEHLDAAKLKEEEEKK